MSEFIVCVSGVFLFIFIAVPIFGRLIDLKIDSHESARFLAWERTVWFDNRNNDNRDDFDITANDVGSYVSRSEDTIEQSLRAFVMARPDRNPLAPIRSTDLRTTEVSPEYVFHANQQSMTDPARIQIFRNSLDAKATPSQVYAGLSNLGGAISAVKKPIDFLLSAAGVKNEDLFELPLFTRERTFYTPTVEIALNPRRTNLSSIESAFYQNWNGRFYTGSAILADGWSAQSEKHYAARADDYVPSTVFDNAVFRGFQDVFSILEAGPKNSAIAKLKFSDVGIQPFPSTTIDCDRGICSFD